MNRWRSILAPCAAAFIGWTEAQDPFHRSFTVEDGLPSDQVYCALQDRDGYMWFGTDAGVSRFDGVEFSNLGPAEGLSDNEVIGIHEDGLERVWFLTLNGRLSYWWNGSVHNASTDPVLGRYCGGSGWATFCEDAEGRQWFGGIRGDILCLDLRIDSARYYPPDFTLRSVVRDGDGPILFVSADGIATVNNDAPRLGHTVAEGWLTNLITQPRSLEEHPIGLAASGVYTISAQGTVLVPGTEHVVDPRLHRSAKRDGQGHIWICRKDEGIDMVACTADGYQPPQRHFGSMRINDVCVTEAGDRWYCTPNQGVLLVDGMVRTGTAHYPSDRNSGSGFISIAGQGDTVWVGTDQGHIHTFADGRLEVAFRPDEGRLPGRILRIEPDDRGNVWFGTDWGLFKWGRNSALGLRMIPAFDVVNGERVELATPAKSVMISSDGSVWSPGIGLWKQVMRAGNEERERVLSAELARPRIYCIAEDAAGAIWVADADRLISLKDGISRSYALPGAFKNSRISDIVHMGGDTLAVATSGNGVLLWRDGRQVGALTSADGLVSNMVRRARLSGDTLWCATSQGLTALRLRDGKVVDSWTWNIRQGLPTNDVYDILVRSDRVLLSTAEGLCVAPLRPLQGDRPPPRMVLAHLLVNDSAVALNGPALVVRAGDRVHLDVHALEFANADLVEYAYMIDDPAIWSPCERGHVVLQGLVEGEHLFRVRARFPRGEWSVPFTLSLAARPPWWASRLSKVAAGLGAAAVLFLVLYYWSRRGFRRKLESMRATAALNEERRRIAADVHDDLGADLSRVLMHARRLEATAPGVEGTGVSSGIAATIDKIDEIIWSLDPKRDTLRSTVHFIEQQARELAEAHGLSYRTVVELPDGDVPLAAAERREVLLIAREAVRNVMEHAHAGTVRIEWRVDGALLIMVVQDDGKGIELKEGTVQRSGLANMRGRAERLGATLRINQVEPHGTRVELRMMLNANHPIG